MKSSPSLASACTLDGIRQSKNRGVRVAKAITHGAARQAEGTRAAGGRLYKAKAVAPKNPSASFVEKLRRSGADEALIKAIQGRKA